jgi:4-amino-4-deoxy-L-arabinose transferase-like glycosyltransferase
VIRTRPGARRALPWLLALLVTVGFAFQGTRGIWEPDEGRYSSAGIHMHESGDWLVPSVDGERPHLTKPPMTYWALAASFALLGHHEWAARLPSALAFVGTGLLVFGLGFRLCPARPWLPPVVWALSFAPAISSNIISTDPILVLFETAAMYAFVEGWSRDAASARRWFLLMWLGWGLAFLTKGPPGILPLLGMIAFLALHDRAALVRMLMPAGVALFIVVAFSWFAVLVAADPDRLRYFVGYEVYGRVFTSAHDRNAQWYGPLEVYLPMLAAGTLPWSVLAIGAAGGTRAAWHQWTDRLRQRRPEWLLLAYWVLVPLAIFCLARSRLQLYVLPLFVPLALIMSRPLARHDTLPDGRLLRTIIATAAVLVALKGVLAYWPSDRDARAIAAQFDRVTQGHEFHRIVFVGMRPYYGLNLYLDAAIEGIQVGERKFAYSRHVAPSDLCHELAARDGSLFVIRSRQLESLAARLARCGKTHVEWGVVRADDNDLTLLDIQHLPR